MLPLTSFFCDVLPYQKGDPKYYQAFLSQYTLMTVPIIISQGSLTPGIGENARADLDEDVDQGIKAIFEQSPKRRKLFEALTLRDLNNVPPMIQTKENRTFVNHLFYEKAKKYQLTNREMILGTLNAFAFTSYFALLEDTLQRIHFETFDRQQPAEQITGKNLISVCLKKTLERKNCLKKFSAQLALRSEFYASFDVLIKMWDLLNFIRNKLVHFGGRITQRAYDQMREIIYSIFSELMKMDAADHANAFTSSLREVEVNIKETGLLQFNNALENMMRNTCTSIIESILFCDRANKSLAIQRPEHTANRPKQARSVNGQSGVTGTEQKLHRGYRNHAKKPTSSS